VNNGVKNADKVKIIMDKPNRLLSVVLLGNNLVNTASASLGVIIVQNIILSTSALGEWAILIETIIMTIILLVLGDVLPKVLSYAHSERLALVYAQPIKVISVMLYPGVIALDWFTTKLSKFFGGGNPTLSITEEEIKTAISVGREEGTLGKSEAEMLNKVLKFRERFVREVMIPRADIMWIKKGTTLSDFLQIYTKFPYSYFPIYEDTPDNILGTLSTRDVFIAQTKWSLDQKHNVTDLMKPCYFIPETKRMGELFNEMKAKNEKTAIIIDEWGGIRGLITLEQMAEEVVGYFGSDLTRYAKMYETVDEHSFLLDGEMLIDQATDEIGLPIPQGNYETVAGFVLDLLGKIPEEGQQIKFKNMRITVTKMNKRKIVEVLVSKGV
ncbi:MAG: hemolysin family protein, partial [Chloroflexi bacterium]|nr:hemolysin family protein [Chloroflexota bacterium]